MTGWRSALLAMIAAVGVYFGTGLHPLWPLIWLAPIPVLLLATPRSRGGAAAVAFLVWCVGGLHHVRYLMLVAPIPTAILVIVFPAILFAAAVLLFRLAIRRGAPLVAPLLFAAFWAGAEFIPSRVSPHGTFGSLAYTQVAMLPILQLASVTGLTGISFLLMLVPASVVAAWLEREHGRPVRVILLSAGIPLGLALGFGVIRLAVTKHQPAMLRVGAAAADFPIRYFDSPKLEDAQAAVDAFRSPIHQLRSEGAELVVLPEKFVTTTSETEPRVQSLLADLARSESVGLVAGVNGLAEPKVNDALLYTAGGELLGRYAKQHLVPGWEDGYRIGHEPLVLVSGRDTIGIAICKDLDFPGLTRRYAELGAGVLFVPAWDFGADGPLHAQMAMVRGVEGGFSVVRAAMQGLATVSDPAGRVLALSATSKTAALAVASVPSRRWPTLYSRFGDWFGWLDLLVLGGAAGVVARNRKVRSKE